MSRVPPISTLMVFLGTHMRWICTVPEFRPLLSRVWIFDFIAQVFGKSRTGSHYIVADATKP